MSVFEYFPMILDVKDSYRRYREQGSDRGEAIKRVCDDFSQELSDKDDGPQVWIGLADVTGRRKELTEDLLQKAEKAFTMLEESFPEAKSVLRSKKKTVCDPLKIGPEARYRKKRIYHVDWQIGDTFAYKIVGEEMKGQGFDGWYIICRKAHEFVYSEDCCVQGMYYSLCPPEAFPQTAKELEQLGYIPLEQVRNDAFLFMGMVWINSRSDEKKARFQKIGNYMDVAPPAREYDITSDGSHSVKDQLPGLYDAYFYLLERDVLEGYMKHGIMPAVQTESI